LEKKFQPSFRTSQTPIGTFNASKCFFVSFVVWIVGAVKANPILL